MKYDAVFFDLDGTIIETIPLWQRAYLETLQEFGIKMNVDDFMSKIYVTSQPLIEALAEQGVVDAPTVQKFRAQRDQKYCEILREEVKWIQGAEQTLRSAKKKAPLGLITGSWRPYVEATDARLNLSKYFFNPPCFCIPAFPSGGKIYLNILKSSSLPMKWNRGNLIRADS